MGQYQKWIWVNKWHVFSVGSSKTYNSYKMETLISNDSDIGNNNLCQNHHDNEGARIFPTNKLTFKETYSFLISNTVNKPTSNSYVKKLFENTTLDLSKIYLLLHLATIDTT